jgi:hypothetical protein
VGLKNWFFNRNGRTLTEVLRLMFGRKERGNEQEDGDKYLMRNFTTCDFQQKFYSDQIKK